MDRITGVQLFARIVGPAASARPRPTWASASRPRPNMSPRSKPSSARGCSTATRAASARPEIGALYYEKCKTIQRELEADNLAALLQNKVGGQLRISTSVAFGRRVVTPLALRFMVEHPTSAST